MSAEAGIVDCMPGRHVMKLGAGALGTAAGLTLLAGCGSDAPAGPPPSAPPASAAPAVPTGGGPGASTPSGSVARERAERIATDRYGGRVLNVEADSRDGEPTWEVEIAGSREGRIEVDVSQVTGAIVEMERD